MKKSILLIASSLLLVAPILTGCGETGPLELNFPSSQSDVETVKEKAQITISPTEGGTITIPNHEYKVDDTLRLIINANKGYSVAYIKVNGEKIRPIKGDYVFKITSKIVEISGVFEKNPVIMSDFEFAFNEDTKTAKILKYAPDRTIIPCPFKVPETVVEKGVTYTIDSIATDAFNSSNIEQIELSKNIETIEPETFANVHGLTSIIVDKASTHFASYDDCLYSKDFKTLIAVPCEHLNTTLTIKDGTTTIGESAALNNRLVETLILPNSVTTLNKKCFMFMHSLSKVTLSTGVKALPEFAFANCNSLKEITLPDGMNEIGDKSFYFCADLYKVVLPSSMRTIGAEAFYRCEKLTDFNFIEGLQTIKKSAFGGVLGFEEIVMPSTLRRLEDTAFETCENLTKLVLNEGLTYLGGAVLYRNPYLKSVNIPSTVTEIHYNPFQGTGEGIISVSENSKTFKMVDDVIYSYDLKTLVCVPYNFRPENLTFKIPSSVTEIGYNAFSLNLYLKRVIIPETVITMECAFQEILPNPTTYAYEMALEYEGTKAQFALINHGDAIWNFRANFKGNIVKCRDGNITLTSQTTV